MVENRHFRRGGKRTAVGRLTVAALALGGLSASALAEGSAGASTSVTVSTVKNSRLGTILASGRTLYTLKASKVACNAACTKVWPELLLPKGVTKAKSGGGVQASKLGTVKRAHGALQVTYNGKPLYWFTGDSGPGQVNGNVKDTWGTWSAVVTAKSSGSGGTSSGSGGVSF